MAKYLPVGLVEQMVLNYSALPPELYGWRNYRIEYGGHAQSCVKEQVIYLPPCADSYVLEMLFDYWQEPTLKCLCQVIMELFRAWLRKGG